MNRTISIKPLPGISGYFAGDDGNIYSKKIWGNQKYSKAPTHYRIVRKSPNSNGYNTVRLNIDKKRMTFRVCRLILLAHIGEPPVGQLACHGKRGKMIDSLDNLYWGSASQNMYDRLRDNTFISGESHHRAKLNDLQIRIIRRAYAEMPLPAARYLGRIFGVSGTQIGRIIRGESWKDYSGLIEEYKTTDKPSRFLSEMNPALSELIGGPGNSGSPAEARKR